jgi:hypothetical protein
VMDGYEQVNFMSDRAAYDTENRMACFRYMLYTFAGCDGARHACRGTGSFTRFVVLVLEMPSIPIGGLGGYGCEYTRLAGIKAVCVGAQRWVCVPARCRLMSRNMYMRLCWDGTKLKPILFFALS